GTVPLAVTGGIPPYTWALAGLPSGLAQAGDAITGRPDTPGTYSIILGVTDGAGRTATRTATLTVLGGTIHVWWDDMDCSPGWLDGEFTAVVTSVEGWFDTPPNQGHDATLVLADGGVYGPKTLDPRVITIQGAAAGPRSRLMAFRDQLAARTVKRIPGVLTIDDWTYGPRWAIVRASTDQLTHAWLGGSQAFTWQVVLTANDPRIYGGDELTAVLATGEEGFTGRNYPRAYPWRYGSTTGMPNFATLTNTGDTDTPVTATYEGPLGQTRLAATDSATGIIVGPLPAGVTLIVNTETLVARAPGGAIRQQMIGAASRPMPLPPGSQTWWLWGTGDGTVTLTWRPAWL
ncbi:MAG: hypothetical protein J2P28_20395, partial [Actinobacteria bacterium]|nr:hypothetical protein [Actinomycetota bacterium]